MNKGVSFIERVWFLNDDKWCRLFINIFFRKKIVV